MSEVKAAAKKAVGNKTTEIIVGTAASKLATAVAGFKAVIEQVGGLEELAGQGILKVSDLEDKIGGLEQDLKNKTAQNKIDLQQQYDTDKEVFVQKYCNENGMTTVKTEEYEELKDSLEEATTNMEANIAKEVGKAVGIEKNNSANALKVAELEAKAKDATNVATIAQLKEQVTFLTSQCKILNESLTAEREAGIKRAQAASISTLNIGGTTQGR